MLSFLNSNSGALNTIANFVMVFIWLFYFQLLLQSVRRERRSSLVISCTTSDDNVPKGIIANMSEGRFYIQNIIGASLTPGHEYSADLTEPGKDSLTHSLQGPLGPGESLTTGPFSKLLERLVAVHPEAESGAFEQLDEIEFELTVIGVHGTNSKSVAAKRPFRLKRKSDGEFEVTVTRRTTQQIRNGRARKQIVAHAANLR